MDSKGIFNIELLASLIVICIIFSMILSLVLGEFSAIDETQNRKEARIITTDVSNIITNVYHMGDGASLRYELPSKINKKTYILKINTTGVYVNSHNQLTYSRILPNTLIQKQYFLESGSVYEFVNYNNSVEIIQLN